MNSPRRVDTTIRSRMFSYNENIRKLLYNQNIGKLPYSLKCLGNYYFRESI
jgi:hypothetical protein